MLFRSPRKKIILGLTPFFILIGLIVFIILKYFYSSVFLHSPRSSLFLKQVPLTSSVPLSPTPRPIPHGKIGFTVSQSDKTKPQFGKGFIDPYDPAKDQLQIVTIGVKDEQPVTQVTAIIKTDKQISTPLPLKLIGGSDIDGIWQGSWLLDDTYLYTYNLVLTADSTRGQSSVEITLR